MTLPSLVNNYKEKELVSRTKKLYSNVQNAVLLAQKDLGTVGDNTFLFDVSQTSAQAAQKFANTSTALRFVKLLHKKAAAAISTTLNMLQRKPPERVIRLWIPN